MKNQHKFYMDLAYKFGEENSTCTRRKVGAVIVKDDIPISTGYNGAPPKVKHCTKDTCLRTINNIPSGQRQELCIGAHAEANAIAKAASLGIAVKGSVLYCTTSPCSFCAKVIARAEIDTVIYDQGYPDELTEKILQNVHLVQIDELQEDK